MCSSFFKFKRFRDDFVEFQHTSHFSLLLCDLKYYFVLLFTSLLHISKRYLDKYDLLLVPGKYNYSLIDNSYKKEIVGLSHLDNAYSNFYHI